MTSNNAFDGLRVTNPPDPTILRELTGLLPAAYIEFLRDRNGAEGWIGASYVRFFPTEQIVSLNSAYSVDKYCAGVRLFASNGCGEAYAFDVRDDFAVYQIPFIPLTWEHADRLGANFPEFVLHLLGQPADGVTNYAINENAFGKEVHAKHPIVFGGNPTDEANEVLVPAAQHPEICTYWNDVYRRIRTESEKK